MSKLKLIQKINQFLWQGSLGNTVYFSYNVSQKAFLIIKGILLAYMCFCFILNQISWASKNWVKQFVFLTLWGFYSTFSYFLLSFIYNSYVLYKKKQDENYIPSFGFFPKLINILFEIVFSVELTITVIFWGIVYLHGNSISVGQLLNTSNYHGGMLIALWIDNCFNAIQFRKSHLVPFSIVSFLYCTVNCIYVLVANENIYPGLNWVSLFSYLELLAAAALSLIHYFIGFYIYKKIKKERITLKTEGIQNGLPFEQYNENYKISGKQQNKSLLQSILDAENQSIQQENFV